MELFSPKPKKLVIFQEETFLGQKIKKKKTTPKKFLIFSQKSVFLIFRENGTLIFWEMEGSSPKIKNFQEGTF